MAEERLKTFGELLKETLEKRVDDSVSSEPTSLSDAERNAILEKVAKSEKESPAQPPSAGPSTTEDEALVPFGVLLERTAKIRAELDKTEGDERADVREAVIQKSKIDMVEKIMEGLRL